MSAIEVEGLTVAYRDVVAVDDLSFRAEAGEVTCVLGPNGAGKTSTVESLEGLRRPALGRVSVIGLDPRRDHRSLVERIGVMLQEGGVHPGVRTLEALRHAAALYAGSLDPVDLLERLGLGGLERRTYRQLSGGEQRRLALALALVGRPQVAFLDEPTTGVDPAGRQVIRGVIGDLRDEGVTVLLTTHDIDEAERVADRVVIIDRARLVAEGPLEEIMRGPAAGESRSVRSAARHRHGGALRPPRRRGRGRDGPGRVRGGGGADAGDRGRHHRLAGRARPAAGRPPGRPPAAGGRVPAVDVGGDRGRADRGGGTGIVRALWAQLRLELALTSRNAESLLLTLGIPVVILVFFSVVDVLPIDGDDVDFLAPGTLALAVLATAFANLAIATGFERSYGVLKRLGATPLGRPRLVAAKALAVLVVIVVQAVVLAAAALALGWRPDVDALPLVAALLLAVLAFTGLALALAGRARALVALAAANAIFVVLLLLSGMVFPLEELPSTLRGIARALPSTALAEAARGALTDGVAVPGRVWPVLVLWAAGAVALAVTLFRWEPSE